MSEIIRELRKQVQVVANARQLRDDLITTKKIKMAQWEEENRELLDRLEYQTTHVGLTEVLLRELTLQAYAANPTNKQPAKGVGVREVSKLAYDPKEAYQWALKHQMALALDKSAFEKIAKADTPDFVRVYTENQATIATNLEIEEEKE
uniref:Uncharacterized protein n=1 Tax=viral metagenome TaxID=1070528 RepID=A0A6M3LS47_9ZZZZ